MKINPISIKPVFTVPTVYKTTETDLKKPVNNALPLNKIPFECLRANFEPSFGKMHKVGETTVFDRKTGQPVKTNISKDSFFNEYLLYNLYAKRKLAGFIRIDKHSDIPEDAYLLTNEKPPFKTFPEITHLRTIEGEKYSKIGSAMINIAINESIKAGTQGALWLKTDKGYEKDASPYRSGENPIPFYYKMGFRAIGYEDQKIQEAIAKGDYDSLPNSTWLVMTPEAAQKFKAEHDYLD